MSDKYKITTLPKKGKSVVATRQIPEEDEILREFPFVASQFAWNKEYKYLCCENCMQPLETAQDNVRRLAFDPNIVLPFSECDSVEVIKCDTCEDLYCSVACMESDQKKNHAFYCNQFKPNGKFYKIYELWKKMHYPPESASIVLIIKIFALIKNNPQEFTLKLNEFCSRSINEDLSLMHKMLGENHSSQIALLYEAFTETFSDDTDLGKYLSYDGFVSLLAIIGTNSQGIGTSSFADYVKKVSELDLDDDKRSQIDDLIDSIYTRFNETVGEFLNCEGSGLFLIQSKINHSCSPNAEIRFPDSNAMLQVVALRTIKENEEICISYLDECQLSRSRHSRRKYLEENYLFECECEKCESQINEPDVTSEEDENDTDMDTD